MASSDTPPPQSLINAAVQSFFAGSGVVAAVALGAAAATGLGAAVGAGAAVADLGAGVLPFGPVNVVQMYYAAFVPSVTGTGQSISRPFLSGPLEVDKNCLAPEFNHDFTNIRDNGKTFRRGNQPYERPCGSYRIALNVKDKFGKDNAWLGMKGDDPNEWPVSYHGTAQHNAMNIAEEGFKLNRGERDLFGKGIYSTPELAVANRYASSFVHQGTSYKCILQNRVNPKYLKVIPKSQNGVGIYWLSASENNVDESELIRPYGLCFFKESAGCTIM
jgi:hypothetical protein